MSTTPPPDAGSPLPAANIFLVGPMGSGKSAVGRALARLCGSPFHDSDEEIERRTGVEIPYIFEREGESGFRARERDVIADLTGRAGIVLATGGGAILLPENRACLSSRGVVVYLEASIEQQVARTRNTRHRPLLKDTDPATRLAELMRVRESLYRQTAHVCVSTDRRKVTAVAAEVLAAVRAHLEGAAGPAI